MTVTTTTIREVADRVRMHPMLQDVSFDAILSNAVDFIRIMGCPALFEEKTDVVQIKDWRGDLPCGLITILGVREVKEHGPGRSYRYATDVFHMSDNKKGIVPLTYKTQRNKIFTSTKDKPVEVSYRAIMVDDEGFPLIPESPTFLKALELYIKKQRFTMLFDLGKLSIGILSNTQQEYAWAAGQCQAEMNELTYDQMESVVNSWNQLLARNHMHHSGFKVLGNEEHIKVH